MKPIKFKKTSAGALKFKRVGGSKSDIYDDLFKAIRALKKNEAVTVPVPKGTDPAAYRNVLNVAIRRRDPVLIKKISFRVLEDGSGVAVIKR